MSSIKKKLTINATVSISFALIGAIFIPQSHVFNSYQLHEHPFEYIGSKYLQTSGDNICRQIYGNIGGYHSSGLGHTKLIYARDGSIINGADRVWYHQQNGECVANK
jgi:hypothetical protein